MKMKTLAFEIDNLKCGGCERTIRDRILKFEGVNAVDIDPENSQVQIEHTGTVVKEIVLKALAKLGYPEKGSSSAFQTARSYVSCAIGKVSEKVSSTN